MTDDKPSKSERKRQALAAEKIGEALLPLSADELARLPLSDALQSAVTAAQSMRSRGALRRQRQLIGKLMRDSDVAAIAAGLAALQGDSERDKRRFASAERWRDRMLTAGHEAVQAFAGQYDADADALSLSLTEIGRAGNDKQRKTRTRAFFRQIHDALLTFERDAKMDD